MSDIFQIRLKARVVLHRFVIIIYKKMGTNQFFVSISVAIASGLGERSSPFIEWKRKSPDG